MSTKQAEAQQVVREMLLEAALELEASAKAARASAESLGDPKIVWGNMGEMCSRLERANSLVDRLQALAKGISVRKLVDDR